MEREHTRVHEENKTEAGKVRWVRPDEDGDSRTKMGTNPDTGGAHWRFGGRPLMVCTKLT